LLIRTQQPVNNFSMSVKPVNNIVIINILVNGFMAYAKIRMLYVYPTCYLLRRPSQFQLTMNISHSKVLNTICLFNR